MERLEWIIDCLEYKILQEALQLVFYISGDALYSLKDVRYHGLWIRLDNFENITILIDSWDLNLLGITSQEIKSKFGLKIAHSGDSSPLLFGDKLIVDLEAEKFGDIFGFLEMRGPYISRTSVHCLRILKTAVSHYLKPELYGYLDGVHLGHDSQKPSEFENIGEGLLDLQESAKQKGLGSLMLACSRCGTARGYLKESKLEVFHQSEDTIPSFLFCNLNRIIDRFEGKHVILSPTSGLIRDNEMDFEDMSSSEVKPSIIIFVTHSPYGSEWTFGAISFALACANHEIATDVVFIEDGVLLLTGPHQITEGEGIFNLQEIIEATCDIENLRFFGYEPSLEMRGLSNVYMLEGLNKIKASGLHELLISSQSQGKNNLKRVIFF